MKCGDKEFVTAAGLPCQQNINPKTSGCLWHSKTPKQRSLLATRGALAAKMKKALPSDHPIPSLDGLASYEGACRDLYRLSLTGNVDRWRLTEARGAIALLMQAEQVRAQQQLYEALVGLERGGPAVVLLNQYLDGHTGGRRPVPPPPLVRVENAGMEEAPS